MIIYLLFIYTENFSINFFIWDIKNKMESLKFSTVYNSVKGNTYLPLISFSCYATTNKLVRGIKSFSTKVYGNKLNPCVTGGSEFLF